MMMSKTLHLLAAVIWVGGMFFAYVALRPAAVQVLEAPARLRLWAESFRRFFPWVWAAVVLLLLTGYGIIFGGYRGMGNAPVFVHAMNGLGLLMVAIYLHVFFAPYRRLRRTVTGEDWPAAAKHLSQIRVLIGVNLVLGLLTVVVAGSGPYWG